MLPTKSIYTRGAEDGAWMGLLFIAAVALQTLAQGSLLATLIADVLLVAVPAVLWVMLRRSYRYDRLLTTFSGLWMHGIMVFLCGSLILGLVAFMYMRFINPGFIYAQARLAVDLYSQIPEFETFCPNPAKSHRPQTPPLSHHDHIHCYMARELLRSYAVDDRGRTREGNRKNNTSQLKRTWTSLS